MTPIEQVKAALEGARTMFAIVADHIKHGRQADINVDSYMADVDAALALLPSLALVRDGQEWVSVKERLPEPGVLVLLRDRETETLDPPSTYIGQLRTPNRQKYWSVRTVKSFQWGFNEVTHWMSLPPAPETGTVQAGEGEG